MGSNEIIKSSLLTHVNAISWVDMVITLLLSLFLGLCILYVYRRIYGGQYSSIFAVSLVGLSMITSTLILAVSSNVVLSLGMVGALSIVRFRSAIKDPLEIIFLFWSIEVGIVLASGFIVLAVVSNFLIGLALCVLIKSKSGGPYILVIKCSQTDLNTTERFIRNHTNSCILKNAVPEVRKEQSGIVNTGNSSSVVVELVFEISLSEKDEKDSKFIGELATMNGVEKALLMTYNGAYTG